ncbi:hypothetical protein [Nostoc sp.]
MEFSKVDEADGEPYWNAYLGLWQSAIIQQCLHCEVALLPGLEKGIDD